MKNKLKLNSINKKDKIILVLTILFIIIVIYSKFLLIPKIEILMENVNKYGETKKQYSKIDSYKEQNNILNDKINNLSNEYEKSSKILPKTSSIAQVIRDFKFLSDKNQIEIKRLNNVNETFDYSKEIVDEKGNIKDEINVKGNEENEEIINDLGIESEKLNLEVTGLYRNLISFIKDIENYNRISETYNVTFTKNLDELICSFDINFYYLKSDEGENYDFNKGNYGKEDLFN